MRAFVIVLDSVGIGAAPDAETYGDAGANTLAHTAEAAEGLYLPVLQKLGLGNIPAIVPGGAEIRGVSPVDRPAADFGALQETSRGKDTTTGHWELMGLYLEKGFHVFDPQYPSFPDELISEFERRTGRRAIGNRAASGTKIIQELGKQQMAEGCWIVYTSADSVFQIAAHEQVIPLKELYNACEIARDLCNAYFVGRVIARPFTGVPGSFTRTENRRDYSFPPPEDTLLDILKDRGIPVMTVGKLDDIFAGRGISKAFHMEDSEGAQKCVLDLATTVGHGFIFANLIDFDMLYGHRRNPEGYAAALASTDQFLGDLLPRLSGNDILIISADHGNDPTFRGTDHTREYVPLLSLHSRSAGRNLGVRRGFYDVAQSLASFFSIEPLKRGVTFLP